VGRPQNRWSSRKCFGYSSDFAIVFRMSLSGGNIVELKGTIMSNIERSSPPSMATALRWSARILSALILLLWSFFIVAHLAGDEGRSSRPLTTSDYTSLTVIAISLAGLGVAWKWERIGAVLTLSAVSIGAIANWKSLAFPISLIPLTAFLFLLSGWRGRRRMRNH
jgi:hypothetical protein